MQGGTDGCILGQTPLEDAQSWARADGTEENKQGVQLKLGDSLHPLDSIQVRVLVVAVPTAGAHLVGTVYIWWCNSTSGSLGCFCWLSKAVLGLGLFIGDPEELSELLSL